jgi:signal transduction histidine kinase
MTAPTPIDARAPRLLYAGAAVLILTMLATTFALILHIRHSEMAEEENHLRNISLTLAEQASRSFQSVDLVISSIAAASTADGSGDEVAFVRRMSGHDAKLLLQAKLSGLPQLNAIVVIAADGARINATQDGSAPVVNVSDRDYFRAMKEDPSLRIYIGEPVRNRGTGAWTIVIARRVSGGEGEFLGLILGAIDMRYFEEFYRTINLGEASSISLNRTDGMALVRVPVTAAVGKTFFGLRHFIHEGNDGVVHEHSPVDGQMRINVAHLLADYPLFILATTTEDEALATWRAIVGPMMLSTIGCALMVGLAAVGFCRHWKQQAMLGAAQGELRRQAVVTDAMRVAKEAAELSNIAKTEFLATMSHELRTPLNAVVGFSEIMSAEMHGPLGDDSYREYVRDIHESGSHLLAIIDDILDVSKAAAGKLEINVSMIDARAGVDNVIHLIRHRIAASQLSLTATIPPGALTLYADEQRLKQMLIHLLSNACKFTPAGGKIDLSVRRVETGLTFVVTDNGIGIPASDLERVLDPFVQVDSSLSRRHEGSGVGLFLVKIMAETHGGNLRLASVVGCGTTATLFLPARGDRFDATDPNMPPAAKPIFGGESRAAAQAANVPGGEGAAACA